MEKQIIKFNLLNHFKSPLYIFISLFMIIVYAIMFMGLVNNFSDHYLPLMSRYLLFVMQFSTFLMIFLTCVINSFIAEKSSNRLEFYMANKVNIKTIYAAYTKAAFLLSFASVILIDIIIAVFLFLSRPSLFYLVFDLKFLFLFIAICLISWSITKLIMSLVMIVKTPAIIRSFLNIALVAFMYIGYSSGRLIISLRLPIDFIVLLSIILLFISVVILFLVYALRNKITSERIILSLKNWSQCLLI